MNDSKVVFFSDGHSYWIGNHKLKSVGYFIKPCFPDFDEQYWLTHSALKEMYGEIYMEARREIGGFKPEPLDIFPKFVRGIDDDFFKIRDRLAEEWERKRNEFAYKGTKFHNDREKEAYDRGFLINPFTNERFEVVSHEKEYDNESITLNLWTLKDGAYLELLVFDLDLGIAGQIDEVYIKTLEGKRYIWINDHKTNEKKPSKSAPDYCFKPLESYRASKHLQYNLQISLYARLLERAGFEVEGIAYTFYKDYDVANKQFIECEYLEAEVNQLFSFFLDENLEV